MKLWINKNIIAYKPIKHGGIYQDNNKNSNIIDFSTNVNPLGCPLNIINIIKKSLSYCLSIYPDSESILIRKKLSNYIKIDKDNITIGNGATEIIYNFCRIFLHENMTILIPIPTFSEYENASRLSNCKFIFFNTMNLNQDFLKFITKIPKNGCIFICNPNNPTGTVIKKNIMLMIIKEAKIRSTLIFIDECFMELSLSNESIINYINDFDNIFLLRSLTKSFGLAGLRIGYGVGNNQIIEILNRIKIPWNVNIIAHNAISSLFKDHSYLKRSKKLINTELLFLTTSISKLHNFFCYNSSVNFILIKTTFNSNYLQKQLLKKKIFIRNCNNFRGLNNHFFRIAVKKHKENICLIKSLEMIARKH